MSAGCTSTMCGILPGGAVDVISGQMQRLTKNGGGSLGLTAVISVLISLWGANGGMKAIFDALTVHVQRQLR